MILLLLLGKLVNILARRKVVFVIVEGVSDDTALSKILSNIFDKNVVHVCIMHCDITTERGVNPSNIVAKIGNIVRDYAKSNHFKNTDFQEIIHITDTDGAYISADNVINDDLAKKPIYNLTQIRTANVKNIIERNKRKSDNIDKLVSYNEIWKIPYKIYYMSCNLDHVLYNKLNTSDREKEQNAFVFAKKYKDNIKGFLNYISQSDFSVVTEYKDSWLYIKQDVNSLQRHTNLGICFKNI